VRRRVQRLREEGIIQIVAVTDPLQLGFRRQAMVGIRSEGDSRQVAEKIAALDEVDYVVMCAGSFDVLAEVVCEDDDRLLDLLNESIRSIPGSRRPRPFSISNWQSRPTHGGHDDRHEHSFTTVHGDNTLSERAQRHLWMHFTRQAPTTRTTRSPSWCEARVPTSGPVRQAIPRRPLGLFTSQIGHGRTELAEAGAKQASELAYFPL